VPPSRAPQGRTFSSIGPPPKRRRRGATARALPLWALAAVLGAGARTASGQEPAGAGQATEAEPAAAAAELPQVEVVSDRPAGSVRAPSAQSTVIEVEKFAGEGRTVAEILGSAPGVALHAAGGPGQATTFSLRGASADQSLVLLDGIPLQGPAGGAIDLATLPASLLSRLVVSRGVLGAQLGAGALGGALELIPRSAPPERVGGGVQLGVGTAGTAQLAADVGGPAGSGQYTAAIQLDTTRGDYWYARQLTPSIPDSPWVDERRENADAKRAGALLRLATRPTLSTELDLLFQATAGDRGLPGAVGSFTPYARSRDQSGVLGARLRGLAGEAVWTVRAWARGDRLEVLGLGSGFGAGCVPDSPGCRPELSRSAAARGEGALSLPVGAGHWLTLSAGGGEEWLSGSGAGRRRRGIGTVAAAGDLRFLGGAVSLHPAVRADAVGDVWGVSPGLGATVRPWADLSGAPSRWQRVLAALELRAGVGRSFRPASFAELYLEQGAIAPNPALQPERAISVDAGIGYRGERLTLSAGVFWSRFQDLILYEQFPPARIKAFNIGAARIQGAETQAVVQLPLGFTAEVAWSYVDAINRRPSATEGGQQLSYRPPHRVFVRGAHRSDRLEGFAELGWTSSMPRNNFGTATLPAQLVLNAGAGVRAVGPLWIDLEVRNLLDDRTRQDLFQYPLPGISFTALARVRL
jgi:vitamin B12 transporter